MFCIAEGLALNESLRTVSLEGNPLGSFGLNCLMRARTRNTENTFKVNIKLAEGEADSIIDAQLFDIDSPEGNYSLDLCQEYDFFVLQHLCNISEQLAQESAGQIEQKQFFHGVKFDGKGKWDPPTIKTQKGLWDFEPAGNLEFTFTQDPVDYKKEAAKLMREFQELDPAEQAAFDSSKLKPKIKEVINEASVLFPVQTPSQFEHLLKVMMHNYEQQNYVSNEKVLLEAGQSSSFWSNQLRQYLMMFPDLGQRNEILLKLQGRVLDSHNKLTLFSGVAELASFLEKTGYNGAFTPLNPTGHYKLNL